MVRGDDLSDCRCLRRRALIMVAYSTSAAGTAGAVLNISNVIATVQRLYKPVGTDLQRGGRSGHLPGVDGRHCL